MNKSIAKVIPIGVVLFLINILSPPVDRAWSAFHPAAGKPGRHTFKLRLSGEKSGARRCQYLHQKSGGNPSGHWATVQRSFFSAVLRRSVRSWDTGPEARSKFSRVRRHYSENGDIVTNHHVVEGADRITLVLADRRESDARLIGSDKNTDLALLKIRSDGDDLPTLTFQGL